MPQEPRILSFKPNSRSDAEILILGTMPGVESLRQQQYYAHPRNQFWKIMGTILDFSPEIPYKDRLKILKQNRIALWDTCHSCIRPGSMDSDIRELELNDFSWFFSKHRKIKRIICNGQSAAKFFRKYPDKSNFPVTEPLVMPSTSPANASKNFGQKLAEWRKALC